VKQLQLLKHFREHGCVLRREGAKHSVYQNTRTGKRTTVPRHREIDNITGCNEWSNSQ
jgi:predicted RNA binding protein YcfA (HicA-like mRNA interferase family)